MEAPAGIGIACPHRCARRQHSEQQPALPGHGRAAHALIRWVMVAVKRTAVLGATAASGMKTGKAAGKVRNRGQGGRGKRHALLSLVP